MTIKENIENRIAKLKEDKDRAEHCEMPDWVLVAELQCAIVELKQVLRFIDNNNKTMYDIEIYKVFIRSAFDGFEEYYFIGDKEQLMTLIGILHSTRLVKIEYIGYKIIKEVPDDIKQIKYGIRSNGEVFTYIREIYNE